MKKSVVILVAIICTLWAAVASAGPQLDESIFKWVQSSARCDYFFNMQQICYGKDDKGNIDFNKLVVPVIKIYDYLMIDDVVAKRRWNGNSVEGFSNLVGAAEYYEINLQDMTVYFKQQDFLDSTFTTLAGNRPDRTVKLDTLSEKSFDRIFYNRIIDYAMRNRVKLALRSNKNAENELLVKMQAEQDEYRAQNKATDSRDNEELNEEDAAKVKAAVEAQNKDNKKDKKKKVKKDNE
ncbi:MAG: hypothetical protein J6N55_10500 [Anaerovibrio sp.]|uniref:hypothetical protein n=1 Tax=Anaerovibrio TaxID=82373 RepID=UPI001B1A347B|nr:MULTISPECIES: hypothetical protein [Anaerovibrio]MBE6106172.1 hypothetical protein [Anaerovibrio lipolyticus]MBO6246698.1 hypothetical protein [Anaerovibrio sp.]